MLRFPPLLGEEVVMEKVVTRFCEMKLGFSRKGKTWIRFRVKWGLVKCVSE
jgi:hypothetical protein